MDTKCSVKLMAAFAKDPLVRRSHARIRVAQTVGWGKIMLLAFRSHVKVSALITWISSWGKTRRWLRVEKTTKWFDTAWDFWSDLTRLELRKRLSVSGNSHSSYDRLRTWAAKSYIEPLSLRCPDHLRFPASLGWRVRV